MSFSSIRSEMAPSCVWVNLLHLKIVNPAVFL